MRSNCATSSRPITVWWSAAYLLRVPRSTYYHRPLPESAENLRLLRQLDQLYLKRPFYGSRKMAVQLKLNRKRIQRLPTALVFRRSLIHSGGGEGGIRIQSRLLVSGDPVPACSCVPRGPLSSDGSLRNGDF